MDPGQSFCRHRSVDEPTSDPHAHRKLVGRATAGTTPQGQSYSCTCIPSILPTAKTFDVQHNVRLTSCTHGTHWRLLASWCHHFTRMLMNGGQCFRAQLSGHKLAYNLLQMADQLHTGNPLNLISSNAPPVHDSYGRVVPPNTPTRSKAWLWVTHFKLKHWSFNFANTSSHNHRRHLWVLVPPKDPLTPRRKKLADRPLRP